MDLVRAFYEAGDVDVDIVVSRGDTDRHTALADGSVDVAFGRVTGALPAGIECVPACLEPIPILVGRRHRLARRRSVPMAELAGTTAWMPGCGGESEWADYYRRLGAEFDVVIDTSGPVFGGEHVMDEIAASPDLVTFGTTRQFPVHPGVVQVSVTGPTPVYPWSLLWHAANRHPAIPLLVAHVQAHHRPIDPRTRWLPDRAPVSGSRLSGSRPARPTGP